MVSEPPVIRRVKSVLYTLQTFIQKNDTSGMGRMASFMTVFAEDLFEELSDKDEAAMRLYMAQIGEVISWIGHGDNERLSPNLRSFAEAVQPSGNATGRMAERDTRPSPDQSGGERDMGGARALETTPKT